MWIDLVKTADFGDRDGMPLELITEELIARQPAEAQVVIRLLLAKLAGLGAELKTLKKTPQNSSLSPSVQHPHATPAPPKTKSQ